MDLLLQALTVVGIVLAVLATAVLGPLVIYRVLTWVAAGGFRLGSRHRLEDGRGDWPDLAVYAFHKWRSEPQYDVLVTRLSKYEIHALDMAPQLFRPYLVDAMYRWIRDGLPGGLLLDAVDAGYDATALDAHRTGAIVLDEAAVQTMRALRL